MSAIQQTKFLAVLCVGVLCVVGGASAYAWVLAHEHSVQHQGQVMSDDLQENVVDVGERLSRIESVLWRFRASLNREMARDATGDLVGYDRRTGFTRTSHFGEFEKTVFSRVLDGVAQSQSEWRALAVSSRLLDVFGPPALSMADSIWFCAASGGAVTFEVAGVRGAIDILRNTEIEDRDVVLQDTVEQNPSRRLRWARARYDGFSKEWVISAVLPVDVDGIWIGNVGMDLHASTLYRTLASIDIAYIDIVVDGAGRLMSGPGSSVSHDAQNGVFTATPEVGEIARAIEVAPSSGFANVTLESGPYMATRRSLWRLDWKVLRLQAHPGNNFAETIGQHILFTAILGAILTIGLAYASAAWFVTRPIRPGGDHYVAMKHALDRALGALAAARRVGPFNGAGEDDVGRPQPERPSPSFLPEADLEPKGGPGANEAEIGALLRSLTRACVEIAQESESLGIEVAEHRRNAQHLRLISEKRQLYLGYLSHDLRTQLNSVIGFADLLKTQVASAPKAEYLDYVIESAREAVRRLGVALGASSIEDLAWRESPGRCQAGVLFRNAMAQPGDYASRMGVELEILGGDESREIRCRKGTITSILKIIALNAISRTPRGGRVTIVCELGEAELLVDCRDGGGYLAPLELRRLISPSREDLIHMPAKIDMEISGARELVIALGGTFEAIGLQSGLRVRTSIPVEPGVGTG